MITVKKIRSGLDKRFAKRPVIGNIIYGMIAGFTVSVCLIAAVLGIAAVFGFYGRLGINYKSWRLFMMLSLLIALLALVIGAAAYFPYRRKGNSLFRKEYVDGTSYKALNHILRPDKNNE